MLDNHLQQTTSADVIFQMLLLGALRVNVIYREYSNSVPPLYKDDIIYTEEDDKATLMNNFFVAQTELDETQATIPSDIRIPEHSLNFLSTSPFDVETMSKSLQLGSNRSRCYQQSCVKGTR